MDWGLPVFAFDGLLTLTGELDGFLVVGVGAEEGAGFVGGEAGVVTAFAIGLFGLLGLLGFFVAGLIAFLCAHLAYIALFRSDAPTLGHRRAVMGTLAAGLTMYGVLLAGGLPTDLRVPVAVYVLVISLMAAQAIGRAATMQGEPSRQAAWGVALGALLFMLSDTLLAINRFVTPLPLSAVWVLTTYYAAQFMIVRHMLPALAEAAERPTH